MMSIINLCDSPCVTMCINMVPGYCSWLWPCHPSWHASHNRHCHNQPPKSGHHCYTIVPLSRIFYSAKPSHWVLLHFAVVILSSVILGLQQFYINQFYLHLNQAIELFSTGCCYLYNLHYIRDTAVPLYSRTYHMGIYQSGHKSLVLNTKAIIKWSLVPQIFLKPISGSLMPE